MSHASGTVTFVKDDKKCWFEYNGTSDVCIPSIWDTEEEMHDNWRKSGWKTCTCGGEHEEVVIESHYGGGFSWEGEACRTCMCITKNLQPDSDYEEYNGWY